MKNAMICAVFQPSVSTPSDLKPMSSSNQVACSAASAWQWVFISRPEIERRRPVPIAGAGQLGQPTGDHRLPQAVVHRLPETQIGGVRQRPHQLGDPHAGVVHRSHADPRGAPRRAPARAPRRRNQAMTTTLTPTRDAAKVGPLALHQDEAKAS